MAGSFEQHPATPRIVSSIEGAIAARRRMHAVHSEAGPEQRGMDQLLQAMHTVKAARFTAAERLERKHTLAVFAMAMVSLYFVGLSVWQTVYAASLSESTGRLVTLVSIMSSIFTLILALIESMNDYKLKAHHMHACALAVNDLYHELKIAHTADPAVVQRFRQRYNEVVRNCPFNHARIDYLLARAERRGVAWEDRMWARLRYIADVYGLYGVCLLAPPLVLALFH